jgi:hypothetical protein
MTPVADADHDIRLEPTIVPLFLLRRLEVNGLCVNTVMQESAIQKIALGGQTAW